MSDETAFTAVDVAQVTTVCLTVSQRTWRDWIPGWAKMRVRSVHKRILISLMVNRGWRPASPIPADPVYFQGNYGYEDEEAIKGALEIVHAHSTASLEHLATLWLQVRYLDRYRIRGDLVECGVWRGGAAGMMALATCIRPRHSGVFISLTVFKACLNREQDLMVLLLSEMRIKLTGRFGLSDTSLPHQSTAKISYCAKSDILSIWSTITLDGFKTR
jgi:hypothetical protein